MPTKVNIFGRKFEPNALTFVDQLLLTFYDGWSINLKGKKKCIWINNINKTTNQFLVQFKPSGLITWYMSIDGDNAL